MSQSSTTEPAGTAFVLSLVVFSLISFLCIGLPLAVLPGYVHVQMGFTTTVAGVVIGSQYLTTLLCRPLAGRLVDTRGAKWTVQFGLCICIASGLAQSLAVALRPYPEYSLPVLLLSRVLLGLTQSTIGISAITWGITRLGAGNTAKMISWNGVAAYGGVGIGAPLGVMLDQQVGTLSLGVVTVLLAAVGLALVRRRAPAPIVTGERQPFRHVLLKVSPYGMTLALGTIGYGTLSAFITLYYAERGWQGAAWALSAYAATFVCTRLVFPNLIARIGGMRVALLCLGVDILGLLMVWLGDTPALAVAGAALTGCGLSLIYPALGVEIVGRISAADRSAGLSIFAMYFDLALGLSGPLMGALATITGLRGLFLCSALFALAGLGIAALLLRQSLRQAR